MQCDHGSLNIFFAAAACSTGTFSRDQNPGKITDEHLLKLLSVADWSHSAVLIDVECSTTNYPDPSAFPSFSIAISPTLLLQHGESPLIPIQHSFSPPLSPPLFSVSIRRLKTSCTRFSPSLLPTLFCMLNHLFSVLIFTQMWMG